MSHESDVEACVEYVGPDPLPEPKISHSGSRGPPVGPWRYVVVRTDGKMLGPFDQRTNAVGYIAHLQSIGNDPGWYDVVAVREGQIPHEDVVDPLEWYESDNLNTPDEPPEVLLE